MYNKAAGLTCQKGYKEKTCLENECEQLCSANQKCIGIGGIFDTHELYLIDDKCKLQVDSNVDYNNVNKIFIFTSNSEQTFTYIAAVNTCKILAKPQKKSLANCIEDCSISKNCIGLSYDTSKKICYKDVRDCTLNKKEQQSLKNKNIINLFKIIDVPQEEKSE